MFALLLLAAALALTIASGSEPARAQGIAVGATERALISAVDQFQASGGTDLTTHDACTTVTTGSHGGGYVIAGVDLKFTGPANSAADLPSVALLNATGTTEGVLTGSPTDLGDNTYAFTPSTPLRITAPQTIDLLIEGVTLTLARTTGFQADDIRITGWRLPTG